MKASVRQQLLQALAVMIKCAWLDSSELERQAIVDSIADLITRNAAQVSFTFCIHY
jgi:hypothetical protein